MSQSQTPNQLTLAKTLELIGSKQLSHAELYQALDQTVVEQNPKLNIYLAQNEQALASASAQAKKPLAGVPVAVKDNFSTVGISTTASSTVLDGYLPQYESTVTKNLQEAGGVVYGKTNMDAWAHGSSTETSQFGRTLNPRNTEHLPGGSSGGSAAAVAADAAIQGVVHLWSLDTANLESNTDLIAATERSAGTVLHLAQVLLQQGMEPESLLLVTQQAQAVQPTDAIDGAAHAPLWGMGKVIALEHPELHCRRLDLAAEGLDAAFFLGVPEDSNLRIRKIADCPRVICAAPSYIARKGAPETGRSLLTGQHECLNLRYPGAPEFQWPLQTADGVKRFAVRGPFESDDGDVLTNWALEGHGLILKPEFEVSDHLAAGRLVRVLEAEPPVPIQMACLYSHRRHQDPKARLLIDYMVRNIQAELARGKGQDPR